MKPELKHYPCWLRELIFPTNPFGCMSRNDVVDNEKALRQVFDNQRIEPSYRVLSMFVLEVIRYKWKFHEMEQSFNNQLSELEERIVNLEQKKKVSKK